ncbi:glycosyltransferase family 2 protein [Pelistega ratti]|uniref:glycosyltransferase family 2 protein n=1 Tax=Pelistega ratti TaxID=2652177 RepID=UPI001357D23B|nr:glycosyltransferase [Pelistega ratti]
MPHNTSPLFSIIVPVYNVEAFVHKALSSVLQQNFEHYELIVINDGSTDQSGDICYSLAQQFPQITFIQTANNGVSTARNIGLKVAKGRYIMFLDGDDFWEGKSILSDITNIIKEKNEPDIIFHSFKVIHLHDPSKPQDIIHIDKSDLSGSYYDDFSLLISRSIYRSSACMKVVKREIIIQNNIFFPIEKRYEDSEWSFKLAKHIHQYAIYDSFFYSYHVGRIGSTTASLPAKNVKDFLSIILFELEQLADIKQSHPDLFEGLFAYIQRELYFATQFFMSLPEEDKQNLVGDLIKCCRLRDSYT